MNVAFMGRPYRLRVTALVVFTVVAALYYFQGFGVTSPGLVPASSSHISHKSHAEPHSASQSVLSRFNHRIESPDDILPQIEIIKKLPVLSINESSRTCNWKTEDRDAMQWTFDKPDWLVEPATTEFIAEKRQAWLDFLTNDLVPWSSVKSLFDGRGMVAVAGNSGTMKRLAILLRQMKRLKSTLPIEIHHWLGEVSSEDKELIDSIGLQVHWNDLSSSHNLHQTTGPGIGYGAFHLKTAALLNSRFAEMLLIDSDNLPVTPPETLFDTEVYQVYGTIFWPDISRTRPENPFFAITNTFCRTDEFEQESGQLVVDKRRFFYHLQLASWFSEQGWVRELALGDKDLFRFSWHALKTKYGTPGQWMTSIGFVHERPGGFPDRYCGLVFAQRHPDGDIAFLHRGLFKSLTKPIIRYLISHGGSHTHYKQARHDRSWEYPSRNSWGFDMISGVPEFEGIPNWQCMDFTEEEHRPLDEILPGMEDLFTELGGYWMLDDPNEP